MNNESSPIPSKVEAKKRRKRTKGTYFWFEEGKPFARRYAVRLDRQEQLEA
jgi:hypothetical protein